MRLSQDASMSGAINKWTLIFNDLNKETEYQEVKTGRELKYVKQLLIVFTVVCLVYTVCGVVGWLTDGIVNPGTFYYLGNGIMTVLLLVLLPKVSNYISNVTLVFSIIVIVCFTVYTTHSETLQPNALNFIFAFIACLNLNYAFLTMTLILLSALVCISVKFLQMTLQKDQVSFGVSMVDFILLSLLWSSYIYIQEFDKKSQFLSGHRRVRNFLKLKQILNILVPALVRDKIRSG